MTPISSPNRNWFLKDEPLSELKGQDRFSHTAYVNLLATTVDELTPPFTLGVFGSWGVGKSSIVNELSNRLGNNNSKTKTVTIDVWKYSDNSLRRQFLYDLQQDLHAQTLLPRGKDYVGEVYEERTGERPGKQRFDLARVRTLIVPLILTALITGVSIWVLQTLSVPNPVQAVLAAIVAPAILFIVMEFSRSIVVVSKDTITQPIYFSEDQFERKFEEIVRDANCTKLVIIVDNLDRCSHELVVDTLSAIKTFLEPKGEKCIFVIPCDDSAIRQHVKAAYRILADDLAGVDPLKPEEYATEYLRKFFSGSIKIDPFLPEEIESYIEHLLSQMKLTEDLPEGDISSLVQMVGFLFRDNPHQLKQFLNNLTSKYLLAREREAGPSPQINPPITDNRLFLAKVVAIESRFPDIYVMFRNDDNLFLEVHSAAITPSRAGQTQTLLNGNEAWALLENFLRTTGYVTSDNPKAFFHLKQSDQEARIPNYTQFDSALRQGNVERAKEAYKDGTPETNAARTEVLFRNITDWVQKGYESYALNAMRVALALRESQGIDGPEISRNIIRLLGTNPPLLRDIHQIRNPKAVFEMAELALPDYRRTVQDAHIEHFLGGSANPHLGLNHDPVLEESLAESFVAHIASLNSAQKSQLRTGISTWNNVRPEVLKILSSEQEAREAFIEPIALINAVGKVKPDDLLTLSNGLSQGDDYDAIFPVLIRCRDIGDKTLADETVQKLAELLEYAAGQGGDDLFRYTCKVATNLSPFFEMADPDHLDRITPYLCQEYQSAQPTQKARLVELMCRYYEQATENSRNQIDDILINDFTPAMPATEVAELLVLHEEPKLSTIPWEQISEQLAGRLVAEQGTTEGSELTMSVISTLVPNDYELLMALTKRLLEGYETERATVLAGQLVSELPRNNKGKRLMAPVLETTLGVDGHMGEPQNKNLLLAFASQHHELHTREYREKLDNHIFELVEGGGPLQEVGLQALKTGYMEGTQTHERYVAISYRIAEWLVQQPVTSPLQEHILEWLHEIVSLTVGLTEADYHRGTLIKWLSERQEDSLPADERRQTLRLLASFRQLPEDVLRELVPKLVYQAQNFPDEPTRNAIVGSLLTFYEGNDPLNSDLWSDLNDYRRSLLNGDDTERKAGRWLDREMRKIRNSAQSP